MTDLSVDWSGDLSAALDRIIDNVEKVAQDAQHELADTGLALLRSIVKGDSFKQSLTSEVHGLTAEIGSTSPLAAVIERGRRPGRRPSPQRLAHAMRISAKTAATIADRIQRRGTKGRHYIEDLNDKLIDDELPRIAGDALERMASLNG